MPSPAFKYDLVLRNGNCVQPSGVVRADVAATDGRIVAVGEHLQGKGRLDLDVSGCHVLPGCIDPHVHFGVTIANQRSRDDHTTGTLAALCGGVTCCGDFTEQHTSESPADAVRRRREAMGDLYCNVFLHANLTTLPTRLEEALQEVKSEGVGSVKVFMAYEGMRLRADQIAKVARLAQRLKLVVMVHAETQETVSEATARLVHTGNLAAEHFFDSRPMQAEAEAICRLGAISIRDGTRFYIVHLSSHRGLKKAREARKRGAKLVLETCPQYLFLSRPTGRTQAALLSCAPPLRDAASARGLLQGLAVGDIEVLATDHCPFDTQQKFQGLEDFTLLPGGLPGVENLVPLAYHLALKGKLPLGRLVEMLAEFPARLFGLAPSKGRIVVGADADLMVLDPTLTTVVAAKNMHSANDYSPYEGMKLRGGIRHVFLGGRLAATRQPDGTVQPAGKPRGRYLHVSTR